MEVPPIPQSAPPVQVQALQTRVVNILTKPAQEWPVIAVEPKDIAGLYRNYIMILAAIPAICGFIGMTVFGLSVPLVGNIRIPFTNGLANMVVSYVLGLVGVYVCALVISKLAPNFGSQSDDWQALKLVAYSMTPGWIAGVLSIIPALGIVGGLIGLYGLYLMYLGIGPLMKTPDDKKIIYMVVSLVVVIVVMVVIGVVVSLVTPIARPMAF